jgi:nucleoside-diphosphate-sugar epimerase
MYDLIRKLEKNHEKLEILGTGLQEKDYVYIDDAINAFLITHERGAPGEEYNVGSGKAVTVNEIATLLLEMMNLDPQIYYTGGKSWQGDVECTLADISKIRSLGWEPVTELKTGIRSLLEWMER